MKILFTGDVYRPNQGQAGNIGRNYHYFKHCFEGCHVGVISEPLGKGERYCLKDWQRTYNTESKMPLTHITEYITRNKIDLVIGFEMPFGELRQLDELGIKYIDILHYPIRFTDFVMYGVRSNFIGTCHTVHDFELSGIVGKMMGDTRFRGGHDNMIPDIWLFAGQTPIDRSLMDERGNIRKPWDYVEQVRDFAIAAKSAGCIPVFKYHPCDWDVIEKKRWFSVMGYDSENIVIDDIYDALARGNVQRVLSLSSSVSNEAHYFNIESDTLVKHYPNMVNEHYSRMTYDDIVHLLYTLDLGV